ncbi:unnamed protein product [Schistocephalus solidus]|uniref:Uncharacterized protein n=1 Tax=Schistocephalus solidus TaxID=70667 RepID=A0A183TIJ3_SCHSO|nr:unnamed protein product [Schistocephalus solidus]
MLSNRKFVRGEQQHSVFYPRGLQFRHKGRLCPSSWCGRVYSL